MKRFGIVLLAILWIGLTAWAWFGPDQAMSVAERRELKQLPKVSTESLLSGRFMGEFESYTLDQFPLRDGFRGMKAACQYFVLAQKDNNGIFREEGQIGEIGYPLDTGSVEHALKQFGLVQELYLKEAEGVYVSVVPDKGYYLEGYPAMDYEKLFSMVREGMPWAEYVDITGLLELGDYYATDSHWRQEKIEDVAKTLMDAMGGTKTGEYTVTALDRPFYGVYYGQSALPAKPETMYLLQSDTLAQCRVYHYGDGSYRDIYDLERLKGEDMYEVFLSGAQSLLRLENPNAATDKELVILRDSFTSALAPLFMEEYAAVTLVDIRYILPQQVGWYVDFAGKDVLFLHSTLVLNKNLI